MTGQSIGFDWAVLIKRLEMRGLWSVEIDDKLQIMEQQMLTTEFDTRAVKESED